MIACTDASLRDWLVVIALLLAFVLFLESRRLLAEARDLLKRLA